MRTHYDNLHVKESASQEVIRGAYKALAQKWHPDKNAQDKERAEKVFKFISAAFEVLSDPAERSAYDQRLQSSREQMPAAGSLWQRSGTARKSFFLATLLSPIWIFAVFIAADAIETYIADSNQRPLAALPSMIGVAEDKREISANGRPRDEPERFLAALDAVYANYPYLNSESPEANQAAIRDALALTEFHISQGRSRAFAVILAASIVSKRLAAEDAQRLD